jgi:uncharacterized membrane protein/Mg-chelatase subunit ChlD
MFGLQIAFDEPLWLILLGLVPILWIFSFKSLSGLGPYRRIFALMFRTVVFTCLVLALAGIQLQKISERVTVIYLLDQSESIPKLTREAMLQYVVKDVAEHRRRGDLQTATEDRAGVIIFGREATIEHPPFADEIRSVGLLESLFELRTDGTNISSALKLAQASFPEDTAKRIVIVTDGNENLGDARTIARTLADNGIGIDVVPIVLSQRAEIAVDKIALPTDIRRGQPMEARVVIENYTQPSKENPTGEVKGRLRVIRRFSNQDELLGDGEMPVTLRPGKNVFEFTHTIDVPAGYTYRADFIPDDPRADVQAQNNSATAFTHVRGKGRVLLIEDWENPGEFATLVQRLGNANIEVEVMPSDRLFTNLAELQGFDCVVLANVPRASGGGDTTNREATNFSDDQIAMLVRNTEQFGCGMVMIGGHNSYGAGGWTNTELEKAMPVDFQIKNAKVKAVGALVMMMHASEMAQGNHWQKVIGQEALKVLGPSDYCGVVHWDDFTSGDNWLWRVNGKGLARVEDRQKIWLAKFDRMQPGDMPQFEPAMTMALKELIPNPASVKHMIVISDGDPSPPSNTILAQYKRNAIRISTCAVGSHGPATSKVLQDIATATGGKYYAVTNPKALPRIFQIEARRVARPLVKEKPSGMEVTLDDPAHEMLENIEGGVPPITGYVLTSVKENPLVEVLMREKGADPENSTVLAGWRYGSGKTVALTTDAGKRWAGQWTGWDNYDKLFSQMIRWAMRPVNEEGKFSIASDVKDGKVRVVVTALDKNDEFLNFLNMSGAGSGPELENIDVQFRQEAPGRYVAEFPADKAGSYLMAINTGQANAPPLLTGITVPYSAEFRERESNEALLLTLANMTPSGGKKGAVIKGDLEPGAIDRLVASVDTFRRTLAKAISSEDFWPIFLLLAACIFLIDVFIRRVTVHFYWVWPALAYAYNRVRGREQEAAPDERLARLRNRKAAVASQIDERRAAARFEPQPDGFTEPRDYEDVMSDAAAGGAAAEQPRPQTPSQSSGPQTEQDTYTERLLAAKKKAQK